ncbi:MAG: hypothetical protein ACK55I_02965, partial [bacterium]
HDDRPARRLRIGPGEQAVAAAVGDVAAHHRRRPEAEALEHSGPGGVTGGEGLVGGGRGDDLALGGHHRDRRRPARRTEAVAHLGEHRPGVGEPGAHPRGTDE